MSTVLTKTILKSIKSETGRPFFQWLNIIFNRIDDDRRKQLGPNRTCAEWLLRNGGAVKFTNATDFLRDYNKLPNEEVQFKIKQVDATDSSITHIGFEHFIGCKSIEKVILHKCYYLEDKALPELVYLKDSLIELQVSSCYNITDTGLKSLKVLTNLKYLILSDLPYVKNKDDVVQKLQDSLPKCNIEFNK